MSKRHICFVFQHLEPYELGNANINIIHRTVQKPCLTGVGVASHDHGGSKETPLT